MRDNTDRYKRFADAYNKAYYDSKPDERKQTLDDEWRNRWKSSERDKDFEIRIAQIGGKVTKNNYISCLRFVVVYVKG